MENTSFPKRVIGRLATSIQDENGGKMVLAVLGGMAELERTLIAEQAKAGLRSAQVVL